MCIIYKANVIYKQDQSDWVFGLWESYVFSCEEKERLVLFGIGRLKLVAETKPPLVLQLQPNYSLAQRAPVGTDHTQSCPCTSKGQILYTQIWFKLWYFPYDASLWRLPFRNWNFLRNPGVTKESQKYKSRPLKSSPVVLMLMEWGLELTKQTVT